MANNLTATVVSVDGSTAKVQVTNISRHRLYHKKLVEKKKYIVDNQMKNLSSGDIVTIEPIRPKSKRKRFRINQLINKNDSEI